MRERRSYAQRSAPRRKALLLHPPLIAVGSALLGCVFVTDLAYRQTSLFQWNNFSAWLLVGGLVVSGLAAVSLGIDALRGAVGPISWPRFGGLAVAFALSVCNAFVHSRDAWTAVAPQGLTLSAFVIVILIAVEWHGWSLRAAPKTSPAKETK